MKVLLACASLFIGLAMLILLYQFVLFAYIPQHIQHRVQAQRHSPQPIPITWKVTPRVGLQVGHWKNMEVPAELATIRGNEGAYGGGKTESEVNYDITLRTARILQQKGVFVDILPATVPPGYTAHAFVTIHADFSPKGKDYGYKAAGYAKDSTGKAHTLARIIEKTYGKKTGMRKDNEITQNMLYYYAFNSDRFYHSIHPSTPGVIVETGYLSDARDRKIIIDRPHVSSEAIAEGIIEFLQNNESSLSRLPER